MSSDPSRPAKVFTIEQANATLPLVRVITTDLVTLAQAIYERRQRLDSLTAGRSPRENDPYSGELSQIEEELEKDVQKLREYVDELRTIGAEPKDPLLGLVDFPCLIDGRLVYLCWKLGEKDIVFWHELDEGFSGRRPLTADSLAGGSDEGYDSWKHS